MVTEQILCQLLKTEHNHLYTKTQQVDALIKERVINFSTKWHLFKLASSVIANRIWISMYYYWVIDNFTSCPTAIKYHVMKYCETAFWEKW